MESLNLDTMDAATALALLEWQLEMGVDEALSDTPVDCYALPDIAPWSPRAARERAKAVPQAPVAVKGPDPLAEAETAAKSASNLDELQAAMAAFDHCGLKRGARSLVFADGNPQARVMVLGEAPGREEDAQGKPFVGAAGQLLDKMLGAIGLDRATDIAESAVYITNVMPWRPPENRDPTPDEVAMMRPFLARHVELANPDLLILMGNFACEATLGKRGITRLRGQWTKALGKPAMPMFHPAALLRRTEQKRDAWADLLAIKARLRGDA